MLLIIKAVKLKFVVFVSGMAVMVIEVLGSRLLAPYLGNSLYVWTSLIGVVLASLSLGYYVGGRLADIEPSLEKLSTVLVYCGIVVCFIPISSAPVILLAVPLGLKYGTIVASTILLSVPSILLGMVSPYAVKLETKRLGVLGATAGNLYAISTVGSIVGTFLTGFVLIPNFGVKFIFYLVGASLILSALLIAGRKSEHVAVGLVFLVLVLAYLVPKSAFLDPQNALYFKETPYYRVLVQENAEHTVRYLLLDIGLQGGILLNSSESAYSYSYMFQTAFALKPDIADALFLGTGSAVTQQAFRRIKPDITIDSVDIDQTVINVAQKYFGAVQDDRLRYHAADARYYLRNSRKRYDVVILDVFTSDVSVPTHLVTQEMMAGVKEHLKGDGIFATNVIGSVDGDLSAFFQSFLKTVSTQFSCVHVFPLQDDREELQNIVIVASDSKECMSKEAMQRALRSLPPNSFIDWGRYEKNLVGDDIDLSGAILLTDDYAPAEFLQMRASEKIFKKP